MKGLIYNFRGGIHTRKFNQMIIELPDEISKDKEKLKKLLGKKVIYKAKTHNIVGTITRLHGKYKVVARFNRGLPGQAIGSTVEIKE